jgi:hypothetical protein
MKSNRSRTAGYENADSDEYFLGIHEEIGHSLRDFTVGIQDAYGELGTHLEVRWGFMGMGGAWELTGELGLEIHGKDIGDSQENWGFSWKFVGDA